MSRSRNVLKGENAADRKEFTIQLPRAARSSNRSNSVTSALLQLFYSHVLTIKTFHYTTKSYTRHTFSAEYLDSFLKTMDAFLEMHQTYTKTRVGNNKDGMSVRVEFVNDDNITDIVQNFALTVAGLRKTIEQTDLQALADQILQDAASFLYKLEFFN